MRNLAFDLDDPLRLAEIMAPHALTTHFKNYRVLRTPNGLALANGSLGEGDIDQVAIAELLMKHNPEINLNIEIHSQFAPFPLDILRRAYWSRHPAPPGDGLAWYLEKAWGRRCRIPGLTICPTADRRGSANRKTCKPRCAGPAAPWPIC